MNMNGRSLTITAAVLVALAALGGCSRDEDKVTTSPETTAPPPAPAPAVEAPVSPPAGITATTPPAGDTMDRTAGQTVDDAGVTAKVKAALMSESGVDGLKINVDTFNGRVTLKGDVPNQGQVDKAGQIARGVEGVKDVDNRLSVSPG